MVSECNNCSAAVSSTFVRVFGDNGGEVDRCPTCASGAEIRNGATVQR